LRADGPVTAGIRLEGTICAVNEKTGLVVVQDGTCTEVVEISALPGDLTRGQRVGILSEGCGINRGQQGIQLGKVHLLEMDGHHPPMVESAEMELMEGLHPIRLEWFNGVTDATLDLQFGKAGEPLHGIEGAVFREGNADGEPLPGLDYACYEGSRWQELPDFGKMEPVSRGTATGLDLSVRSRPEDVALVFTGYLRIPESGRYRFQLTSDDGSRLFVGQSEISVEVRNPGLLSEPQPEKLSDTPSTGDRGRWVKFDGRVNFASSTPEGLLLEVQSFPRQIAVKLPHISGVEVSSILNQHVRITGLERASGVIVIDADDLEVIPDEDMSVGVMTQASEIRRLSSDDARKEHDVDIQGVVTMVSQGAMVIQDLSGGVFVSFQLAGRADRPKPGEFWRVRGTTDPGDFSPVIRASEVSFERLSSLPPPVKPSWEQLLNGSLDAEFVEIEGVVVESTSEVMRLLTREGIIEILDNHIYPLPGFSERDPDGTGSVGSLIRIRGVYASTWDVSLGRVHPAKLHLGNAILCVDVPPPADPFSAPLVTIQDLHRFTSHSNALKRFRLRGMVLHANPPEYLLCDGKKGFRIRTDKAPALSTGDLVEAVGFPRLGGPSPLLLEADVRKTGSGDLPPPVRVSATDLPNIDLDSTMVEMEAELMADTVRQGKRVLELRAGSNVFIALLSVKDPKLALIESQSLLRISGVYVGQRTDLTVEDSGRFELRVPSLDGIVILKRGPWWTSRHTIGLTAILSGGLLIGGIWVAALRRTVARRTKELAREIEEREIAERHRAMEQERSRVARDLHDELGAGLTEVGMISSALKNDSITPHRKSSYLQQLSNVSFYLVTSLDEIVWAVNPNYDSVADLATYFSLFAQKFLELGGIRCRLKIDRSIPLMPLDSSARHGIFLAFKEALNNVVKHSEATEVTVRIGVEEDDLIIEVCDDGRGFERSRVPHGCDGLQGMENRIRLLGGACEMESEIGKGTCTRFRIPTRKTK
ncbi:MAG: hypothetical protein EOP85_01850, partial [Verrucomicrobiaceae bacterium]